MRQIRWLSLALVAPALLLGCRGEPGPSTARGPRVRVLASAEASTVVGAARQGAQRLVEELSADVSVVGGTSDRARREALRAESEAGADLVFCVGRALEAAVYTEARSYPSTRFVLIPGSPQGSNVAGMHFKLEEAAFLGGVLAGLLSQGRHVGVIQGEDQPWLELVGDGFIAGVHTQDPGAELIETEGGEGPWVLAAQGVRVALYTADAADPAVLAAAHDSGVQLILTDPAAMVEHPDVVLAAITVDLPEAMIRVAREVVDGTFRSRLYTFDVGSGVVDLELSASFDRSIAPAIAEVLEAKRAEINAGWFEIEQLGIS